MPPLETRIRRALTIVQAAIRDPAQHQLREANERAAALLDDLDPWTLRPDERRDVGELAAALRTLRLTLASNDTARR